MLDRRSPSHRPLAFRTGPPLLLAGIFTLTACVGVIDHGAEATTPPVAPPKETPPDTRGASYWSPRFSDLKIRLANARGEEAEARQELAEAEAAWKQQQTPATQAEVGFARESLRQVASARVAIEQEILELTLAANAAKVPEEWRAGVAVAAQAPRAERPWEGARSK
ncbi:MAG: hypothetical protein ACK4N5_02275 [Myxococcales bacterium]